MHDLLCFGQEDVPFGLAWRPCRGCNEHAASQPYKATGHHLGLQHLAGQTVSEQHGAGRGLCRKEAWYWCAHCPSLA